MMIHNLAYITMKQSKNLFTLFMGFRAISPMNQSTIAGPTLHPSYNIKTSTSFGFIVMLSKIFVDFDLQYQELGCFVGSKPRNIILTPRSLVLVHC